MVPFECLKMFLAVTVFCVLLLASAEGVVKPELTIVHFNDFHSRFETVNPQTAGNCEKGTEDTCVGGFARMHAKITELKKADPQALVVNAGDVFTGTLWFGLFKWNVTAEFMNMLPVDVQTLGNHEFDIAGPQAAVKYLKLIRKDVPTVISNVDASQEPDLEPFIKKWTIVEKNGLKIGIVGYVATDYPTLEKTGNLVFHDEAFAANEAIKELRDKNVDLVVAVSHTGYKKDLVIAQTLDADIIVGAHSHTFLYTGTPPSSYDKPAGPYPTVVKQTNGNRVLIVQAYAYSKYMGYIKLKLEKKSDRYQIASWEGNPIYLDKSVHTDPTIENKMLSYREEVDLIGSRKLGETLVALDSSQWVCHLEECSIGRMLTDAMVYEYTKQKEGRSWTRAGVAVLHSGGIRSSILKGNITFADLWNTLPFEDTIGMVELNGQHFKEMLEFSVEKDHSPFLQMSGVKAKIDMEKPPGERVSDIFVRCSTCPIPSYEPLIFHKYYRIIMAEYMYEGGDAFTLIKKRARFWAPGRRDTDVVFDYLNAFSPLIIELDENVSVKYPPHKLRSIRAAKKDRYK